MRPGLKIGEFFEFSTTVDASVQATDMNGVLYPLYGIAGMVRHMEWAARQLIFPYVEEHEEVVGHQVDIKALSPTPANETVRIRVTITKILPQRIFAHVEVWNKYVQVGMGTLVQALVSQDSIYSCIQEFSLEGLQHKVEAVCKQHPDDAMLIERVGQKYFSLKIIEWEHALAATCTRYDEWLVCEIWLSQLESGEPFELRGPFLLRHEIEEWADACLLISRGDALSYQSDFLEPVLGVRMFRESDEVVSVNLTLAVRDKRENIHGNLSVSLENLEAFAKHLQQQLVNFPSRL